MSVVEPEMTAARLASLVDAAFRTPHPLTFRDAVVTTLKTIGRHADGATTAWIGCLYAEGEVEVLMGLRAAWLRDEHRSPADAASSISSCEG